MARFDAQNRNAPRSTPKPDPGRRCAMMRRRTRPSARTTRTAPTAPCVPVSRDGARVPRSVPPVAGPVTGNGSCTSVEGGSERSTGSPDGPADRPRQPMPRATRASPAGWRSLVGGLLALAALAIYLATYVDRYYDHFVWQAAAFLEGSGRHPLPGRRGRRPARQRVLPGRAADRDERRDRPRPAAVPAAPGRRPAAVRRAVGPRDQRPGHLHGPGRRRRRDLLVGDRTAAGRAWRCGSRRRSSSPSGPSSGSRRRSRRPGTRRISSRSG